MEVRLDGCGHEVSAAGDADAELFVFGVVAGEVGVGCFAGEAEGSRKGGLLG